MAVNIRRSGRLKIFTAKAAKISNINQLPEEMLIEILEYLDGTSVKEAALVCKE